MSQLWQEYLAQFKTSDLVPKNFKLTTVKSTDYVVDVLQTMTERGILSVPVWNTSTSKYVGFVDMLDLVTVLVVLSGCKQLLDALCSKEVDWVKYIEQEKKVFAEANIEDLIDASTRNPWCPVYQDLSLRSLMDMFAPELNLHRVPVTDDQGNVVGIVSQSKVVEFLSNNLHKFPDKANQAVKDLHICPPKHEVLSINIKELALEAYKTMVDKRVSGLAVVRDDGTLVASISVSDLKGSLKQNIFSDLYLPIGLYLDKCIPSFERRNSKTPICCLLTDTIKDVVAKLSKYHVHRLFVVDANNKPVDVFSLCDVISFLNQPSISS